MSILKPWGKIWVEDSKNKFKVDVWGREYTFDNSIFPTSVISQNEELLYEPIELAAEFDGDTKEIYNCKHSIIKQDDEKVVVCSSALLGNIIINASTTIEYCGGFGSCRPYPGKDIFSSEIQFMWDKDYLYVKYDIVDKIYIAPSEELHMMYLSDTTTLNVDPFLARSKSRNSGCEMILGFPKHKGVIFCTYASVDKDGKPYSDCKDNTPINGKLTMEQTKNGRIVTAKTPWKEISPMIPDTGTHIGITVGCLNNEGAGLVDNMQWPWPPTSGSWLFPCSWGVLALID